jgi:hypothetical protein
MKKMAATSELKNTIQKLQIEQHIRGLELKEQYIETFNPINLLKDSLKGVATSPGIVENVIAGGVGLLSGFITRKVVVGSSGNIFRKLIGSALQFGATSIVTQNAGTIMSVGQFLLNLFLSKKKTRNNK